MYTVAIPSDMKNLWQSVCELHARFVAAASYLQSPFLLLFVRVYWGWEFAEDGWGKIHNLGKVTDYFASLNLPMPGQTALFVSVVELVGGVLLILGLLSRLTGLVLTVNMIVAFLSVEGDRAALFSVFTDPDKFSAATPYGFLFASLVILIFGPGKFSLDWLITRKDRGSRAI
jgi:putative oxidoreductase